MKKFGEVFTKEQAAKLLIELNKDAWYPSEPGSAFSGLLVDKETITRYDLDFEKEFHDMFYYDTESNAMEEDEDYITIPEASNGVIDFNEVYDILKDQDLISGLINLNSVIGKRLNEIFWRVHG
ncbi:hypothetical protein CPT_Madawaska_240 [Staphylococcus phage Madawaska]|nr:hypothetical protein CPT_Madawaska_240 [Staphylococcus phage Madawaska]